MMMDLDKFETVTRAAFVAATNGTDQRLDAILQVMLQILAEVRMTREEWKKHLDAMEPEFASVNRDKKPPRRAGK